MFYWNLSSRGEILYDGQKRTNTNRPQRLMKKVQMSDFDSQQTKSFGERAYE